MPYDPIPDSNDIGRKRLILTDTLDGGPLIVIKPGECFCGCHERPARKRRFKPGHDTRFRGIIERARRAGVPVTVGRVERPAEEWEQWLSERKESEAVRRREVRRDEPAHRFFAAHEGKDHHEILFEMMDADPDLGLQDAEAILESHERRLRSGAKRPSTQ